MDKIELVDKTIEIVKTNWTQGENVKFIPERGLCFCLNGAMIKASGAKVIYQNGKTLFDYSGIFAEQLRDAVYSDLREMLDGSVVAWNDTRGRTPEEVVDLLERYRATLT